MQYLTTECVAFCRGDDHASWWKRIVSCKLKNDLGGGFVREYAKSIDIGRVERTIVNSVATYALYRGNSAIDLTADFADLVGVLNDNDAYGASVVMLDSATGEVAQLNRSGYEATKKKKERRLKAILNDV